MLFAYNSYIPYSIIDASAYQIEHLYSITDVKDQYCIML